MSSRVRSTTRRTSPRTPARATQSNPARSPPREGGLFFCPQSRGSSGPGGREGVTEREGCRCGTVLAEETELLQRLLHRGSVPRRDPPDHERWVHGLEPLLPVSERSGMRPLVDVMLKIFQRPPHRHVEDDSVVVERADAEFRRSTQHSLRADHLAILLGLRAGLRRGEILALQLGDFDLRAYRIQVRRRISRHKVGAVKSKTSRRSPSTRLSRVPARNPADLRSPIRAGTAGSNLHCRGVWSPAVP